MEISNRLCSEVHLTRIECMASNGRLVASGAFDSSIILWDAEVA